MKTMTCKQLGGACDAEFQGNTSEEIAKQSKKHGMQMFQIGDKGHIDAMNKMNGMMAIPETIRQWFEEKRKDFDSLPNYQVSIV